MFLKLVNIMIFIININLIVILGIKLIKNFYLSSIKL